MTDKDLTGAHTASIETQKTSTINKDRDNYAINTSNHKEDPQRKTAVVPTISNKRKTPDIINSTMRKPTTAKAVPIPAPTVKTPDIPRHEEEVKILYEKVADVINDSIILPFEPDQTPEFTFGPPDINMYGYEPLLKEALKDQPQAPESVEETTQKT